MRDGDEDRWPASDGKTNKGRASIAGYVLAGGASSRFGTDKAQVEFGGTSMLARMRHLLGYVCDDARVIVATQSQAQGGGYFADRWPGEGPLGGIVTALLATAEMSDGREWNLIVGCDMPFLNADWLGYLAERAQLSPADVIAPQSSNGLEPLCAVWRSSAAQPLQTTFDSGVRKVTEAMKRLRMEIIDESEWKRFDSQGRLFWNMNTVADYEEAKRSLQSGHG